MDIFTYAADAAEGAATTADATGSSAETFFTFMNDFGSWVGVIAKLIGLIPNALQALGL
ncbi:hypothetical protein [Corynebacterium falsenii]|uniref:hypothetical protein n=1 Tax=Corynebacterium falsenii TaxID=108486 RepID=UPI0003E95AB0|nr:hypothetical protein [Corynebacterium falsenii]AHI04209.1 hypothetical protein CFAL_01660 [Corynebacterium falsenii DSM 44353]MDC7104225.1 hypothetical protein [Corynebacterium falsenii]UBI05252.1 hypothetical protein LA343_03615 [Corynebacterium falsenii]HJF12507.1 hypothetical protein [Corynebacterium falsenii]